MREWLNRAVSKTVEVLRPPWVRIPPSPPSLRSTTKLPAPDLPLSVCKLLWQLQFRSLWATSERSRFRPASRTVIRKTIIVFGLSELLHCDRSILGASTNSETGQVPLRKCANNGWCKERGMRLQEDRLPSRPGDDSSGRPASRFSYRLNGFWLRPAVLTGRCLRERK